jgi:L-asparaginase II
VAVLAEVVRCGFVEGRHHGTVVALDAAGEVAFALGNPLQPVLPRSANKPAQAAGMLVAGLDRLGLDDALLAIAASSHSGEPAHLDAVRAVLARAGLGVDALQTPPDLPGGREALRAWLRAAREPEPIAMNCSGKHAAMLATCVAAGWDPGTYRAPDHPLQVALRATLEELAGESVAAEAVDGCGAPVWALSLVGLARVFRACVLTPAGSPPRRVADAMRAHPELVGGTDRDVTALMRGVPGLLAKDGAEAVYAAALPDGRAVALKVADGGDRARPVVMAAALRALGVRADVLDVQGEGVLLGGGVPVGAVRPAPDLRAV